jgi:signal transduction histidine kinase
VVWRGWAGWEVAVAVAAVLAAGAAVWVTLEADFLAHPGWLAVQKADFILGPVFVGLYWRRARPESRFGPLLIGFGAVGAVYILQSSSNPWLFGVSLHWESVVYLVNLVLILTFPTGRLDGLAAKLILLAAVVAVILPYAVVITLVPQLGPDGSISGCRALCPDNALAITSQLSLAVDLTRYDRVAIIIVALATGGLLVWRMVTGTPPQRRALAIGAPIALLFTLLQITYQLFMLVNPNAAALHSVIQWGLAGARSLIWYGFLFALIAAQLFAGRVLHSLVRRSLRRPSQHELETMMREPLGDPGLRLAFWDPETQTWTETDAEGINGPSPEPESGRGLAIFARGDGTPAVAIDHDAQLADDPELLRAVGAVALLAAENAELDAASNDAQAELRRSRARIVAAGDSERKKLERNLHDGVQQRLVAVRIRLALAGEHVAEQATIHDKLEGIGESVEEAIEELREVAHGLYPPVLTERGLLAALTEVRRHATTTLDVHATHVGQHPAELESAVYYCCLEAIQNATKHGGPAVQIAVMVREDADELSFEVSDDGPGFDASDAHTGTGLQNMRDRVGALNGHISIVTTPGHGTTVSGSVPLHRDQDDGYAAALPHIAVDRD